MNNASRGDVGADKDGVKQGKAVRSKHTSNLVCPPDYKDLSAVLSSKVNVVSSKNILLLQFQVSAKFIIDF